MFVKIRRLLSIGIARIFIEARKQNANIQGIEHRTLPGSVESLEEIFYSYFRVGSDQRSVVIGEDCKYDNP